MIWEVVNETSLLAMVGVCWWLVHVNSAGPEPFSRSIATLYGLAGTFKALAAVSSYLSVTGDLYEWSCTLGRVFLVFALTAVAFRLNKIYTKKE